MRAGTQNRSGRAPSERQQDKALMQRRLDRRRQLRLAHMEQAQLEALLSQVMQTSAVAPEVAEQLVSQLQQRPFGMAGLPPHVRVIDTLIEGERKALYPAAQPLISAFLAALREQVPN